MKRYLSLFVASLFVMVGQIALAGNSVNFKAHLDGFDLFGNPVATNATGNAKLEVIDDGSAVEFRVNVAGIRNLWMAHIHVADGPVVVTGPAGPIAFWFVPTVPGAPPEGVNLAERVNGRLSAGFIITDEQLVGPLAPDPGNPENTGVNGLVKAMMEGRASVIVHTNDWDPDTPTGVAGDSPPGELRGTVE